MDIEKKVYVFDLDDTLVKTTANILVRDAAGSLVRKIPTHIYNAEGDKKVFLSDGEYFDFEEFNSLELLAAEETTGLFEVFKKTLEEKHLTAIITSREKYDLIQDWLKIKGISDNPYLMIYCTFSKGFPFGGTDANRKKLVLEHLVDTFGITEFIVYDDAEVNVAEMLKLNNRQGVSVIAKPVNV